jgi:hypothetical protein
LIEVKIFSEDDERFKGIEMADGMLGVLGEEARPEPQAREAVASAEAYAAALAASASRRDPQAARDTSTFLNEQLRVLDLQAAHLEDQHAPSLLLQWDRRRDICHSAIKKKPRTVGDRRGWMTSEDLRLQLIGAIPV